MSKRVWRIRVDFVSDDVVGSATIKVTAEEADFSGPNGVEIAKKKLLKKFDVKITGTKFLSTNFED